MNTAIKIDTALKSTNQIEKAAVQAETGSFQIRTAGNQAETAPMAEGRNARRLALIIEQEPEKADVFDLFGWNDLPVSVKQAIRTDMEAYRDELLGVYSTCDNGVKSRRKRVSYWVKAYREGICSEETAADMLSVSFLE